jgi:hypothetical protein
MRGLFALGWLCAAAGCVSGSPFVCHTGSQCPGGRCEPAGACSFPDSHCPSGWSYGSLSDPALAGQCVNSDGGVGPPLPDGAPLPDGGALPPNLTTNPGCEVDSSGWDTDNAVLPIAIVSGGHSGSFACEVCSAGSGTFTMDDFPNTEPSAVLGATYVGAAWVRLPAGQPSQIITLVVRERNGTDTIDDRSPDTMIDSSWRELRATHVTSLPGSSVDIYIGNLVSPPLTYPPAQCFDIDDITLGHY